MTTRYVLDAWAMLALIQKEEPAASRVRYLLEEGARGEIELFISIINLGEIIYRIGKVKGEDEAKSTLELIRRLTLTIVSATDKDVFAAVDFKMQYSISYADAFAVATAKSLEAILVTGDPELTQVQDHIQLEKLERN